MPCHWRTMPRKPLLMIANFTGSWYSTIVASSCSVIWKPPSPQIDHTVDFWSAIWAPIAAGGVVDRLDHVLGQDLVGLRDDDRRVVLLQVADPGEPLVVAPVPHDGV